MLKMILRAGILALCFVAPAQAQNYADPIYKGIRVQTPLRPNDLLIQPGGAPAPVSVADKLRRRIDLDDYKAPGDGDDCAAFQRAHDANDGSVIQMPAREIVLPATCRVAWTKNVTFEGQSVSETCEGGTRLRWTAPAPGANLPEGSFVMSGTAIRGGGMRNVCLAQAQPQTLPGWAPTAYPPVFYIRDAHGGVNLTGIYASPVYHLVDVQNSGRLTLDYKGQALWRGVTADRQYDVDSYTVHHFPMWSAHDAVLTWTRANSEAVALARVDTPKVDIFAIHARAALHISDGFDPSSNKTTSKLTGKVRGDATTYPVLVDGSTGAQLDLDYVMGQGEISPQGTGATDPAARAIYVTGANARLHVGQLRAERYAADSVLVTGANSVVTIGAGHFMLNNQQSVTSKIVSVTGAGSSVSLAQPPVIDASNGALIGDASVGAQIVGGCAGPVRGNGVGQATCALGAPSGGDDVGMVQAAIDALSAAGGGTVYLGAYGYRILSADLTIPLRVTLSAQSWLGVQQRAGADFTREKGALYVSSARTIRVRGALEKAFVLRDGITAPTTTRGMLDQIAAFAGTGVTIVGSDGMVRDVAIGGFGKCVAAANVQRPRVDNVVCDATSGLSIDNAHDIPKVRGFHAWPFLSANVAGVTAQTYAISAVSDSGAGVYRLTVPVNQVQTGDPVYVTDVSGALGANGAYTATVVDATHIDLIGSVVAPAKTGATTNGQKFVAVNSTEGLVVGQSISGSGIPAGATIAAVVPGQSAIYLSAPATATASGVALSIANAAYAGGGTLRLDANQRSGIGVEVTNSETAEISNSFAYGYRINARIGEGAGWTQLINWSSDGNIQLKRADTVGVLIEGSAYGTSWIGGSANSSGRALSVASSSAVPQIVSGVTINPGAGPMIEATSGRMILSSNGNAAGGAVAVGPSIGGLTLAGNALPAVTALYASDAARTATSAGLTNAMPAFAIGAAQTQIGAVKVGIASGPVQHPLEINSSWNGDVNQGAQVKYVNPAASSGGTKYSRISSSGAMEWLNSTYSAAMLRLMDDGRTVAPVSLSTPQLVASGAALSLSGACAATVTGGTGFAGSFRTTSACAGTAVTVTLPTTGGGYYCGANNLTTPGNSVKQTGYTTTTATFTVTSTANDMIAFACVAF